MALKKGLLISIGTGVGDTHGLKPIEKKKTISPLDFRAERKFKEELDQIAVSIALIFSFGIRFLQNFKILFLKQEKFSL